jgi:transcriptional regulator with XRE-family HTH domain
MKTPDERILRLIDLLKFQKTIKTINEFCEEIGVLRQTIYKIKNGDAGFTVAHIGAICKKYKINANWIFGVEPNVFNDNRSITL